MAKAKVIKENWHHYSGCCGRGYFLPLLLIFIGGYYLARNQGLVPENFPFWSSLLVVIGLAMLLKRLINR